MLLKLKWLWVVCKESNALFSHSVECSEAKALFSDVYVGEGMHVVGNTLTIFIKQMCSIALQTSCLQVESFFFSLHTVIIILDSIALVVCHVCLSVGFSSSIY